MARIVETPRAGERPLAEARSLPEGYGQVAESCDFRRGSLRPIAGWGAPVAIPQAGSRQGLFRLGGHWLAWTAPVSVLPVPGAPGRIAYAGDGYPKVTDEALATAGGVPATYPADWRRLGVPPPKAAIPQATPVGGGAGTDVMELSYCHTLVSVWGEESAPSDPTGVLTIAAGQAVQLAGLVGTNPSYGPPDHAACLYDKRRIYRSESGTAGEAEWRLVLEIAAAQDAVTDTLAPAAFDVLVTAGWEPPPDATTWLAEYVGGMVVALAGTRLLPSESGYYYAFNTDNAVVFSEEVVACGHWGTEEMVVVSASREYRVVGGTPETLQLLPQSTADGCVAAAGFVAWRLGCIYPARVGLVLAGPGGREILTHEVYTPEQWQELALPDLVGFVVGDFYLACFPGLILVVDIPGRAVVRVPYSGRVTGGWWDDAADVLYLLVEEAGACSVQAWLGAAAGGVYRWRGRIHAANPARHWNFVKVLGDFRAGATCLVRVIADGATAAELEIAASRAEWLPADVCGSEIEIEVEGSAAISAVLLATGLGDIRG